MKNGLIFSFIIIILIFGIIYYANSNKDSYKFSANTFSYSQNRGKPDFKIELKEENNTYEVYSVNFQSRNFLDYETRIYGLLFVPKISKEKKVPGLVFLPGGGVTKEGAARLASKIANEGYAVITIDQRGIGETSGYYLNIQEDYQIFSQGKEPIQHLSVYDALKTFDVLREIKGVDRDNIAIMGESMGGRYAIIASALDKRLKGVIVISSSGFHIKPDLQPYNPYLISIDPDHYIDKISPNPVFMLQGSNDSVVSLKDAKITFEKAGEPKRFFIAEGCSHGFCDKMWPELKQDLVELFS